MIRKRIRRDGNHDTSPESPQAHALMSATRRNLQEGVCVHNVVHGSCGCGQNGSLLVLVGLKTNHVERGIKYDVTDFGRDFIEKRGDGGSKDTPSHQVFIIAINRATVECLSR